VQGGIAQKSSSIKGLISSVREKNRGRKERELFRPLVGQCRRWRRDSLELLRAGHYFAGQKKEERTEGEGGLLSAPGRKKAWRNRDMGGEGPCPSLTLQSTEKGIVHNRGRE